MKTYSIAMATAMIVKNIYAFPKHCTNGNQKCYELMHAPDLSKNVLN